MLRNECILGPTLFDGIYERWKKSRKSARGQFQNSSVEKKCKILREDNFKNSGVDREKT